MNTNYLHFPDWLKRNYLFRKLFLLRKLFLTRRSFRHYGQFGEDISLVRLFPKGYKGFFVDVGCFHPVKYNNTYRLYRKGWRGVNIDLDPIKIEGFRMVRPGDVNILSAVSDRPGELTYWTNGFYSLTVTLDEAFARGKMGYRQKTVKADTLTRLLDGTRFKGQPIDLLTIDAEGHDFQVLSSLDFDRYQPKVIAVETHQTTLSDASATPLFRFLVERGYELVNWTGLTLIFSREAPPRP